MAIATAFAQDASDCGSGFPAIAGTSGLENARTALTTNRQVYGAAAFAERHLFQARSEDPEASGGVVAYEWNVTHNVARVPVWVDRAASDPTACPEELLLATSPLNLMAGTMGGAFRAGRFGGFYAASMTLGQPAHPNAWVDAMTFDMGLPFVVLPSLMAAPVAGTGYFTSQGASAVALEWVGGVSADLDAVSLHAGYAGVSRGFYANAAERRLGLYASASLSPGGALDVDVVDLLEGGLDRLDPVQLVGDEGSPVAKAGVTSAFYRDLPYGAESDAGDGRRTFATRLRTGHLQQDDLFRIVDVRVAYALSPTPLVHEATVGVHNPGFVRRRQTFLEETAGGFRVAAGMVQLPQLATLGVEGGTYPTLRADIDVDIADALGGSGFFVLRYGMQINDAEQLALYPFARNAVSYRIAVYGGGGS